jgi:hypothetical protein
VRRLIFVFALTAMLLLPAGVRADVDLTSDLTRPADFVTEREVEMTQTLTLAGMPLDTKVTTTERHQVTQGKQDAEGNHLFQLAQQSMRTHMELPGGMTLDIDTAADKAEASTPIIQFIADAIKATAGLKVTFAVSPQGKVQSADADVPGLDNLDPQALAIIQSQLEEDSLKRELQQDLDMLPDRVVKPGEFWNATIVLNAGQGQLLTFTRQCEYVGPVDIDGKTLHQIDFKDTDIKFEIEPGSQLEVKDSDLSIAESKGEMYFDSSMGRVIDADGSTRITGELTLVIGGQEYPSTLGLTMTAKSREVE